MNVTVRNVITSMRLISWFDWAQFVESVSLVDQTLRDRQRVRRDGLRDAGPLSPRRRGAGPRHRSAPRSTSATGRARMATRPTTKAPARDADRRSSGSSTRPPADPGYYLISDGRLDAGAGALGRGCSSGRPAPARLSSGPRRRAILGSLALARPSSCWPSRSRSRLPSAVAEPALVLVAVLALGPGLRRGRGVGQPRRDAGWSDLGRCRGSSCADGVAVGAADAGRRADPPRAMRPTSRSRSPGSRSTTWPTRTATSGSPCCPTGSMRRAETVEGDDELLATAVAAIDRLNARHGESSGRWRPLPPLPSKATLERGRRALDGLGAQARQAPRAERAAPRVDGARTS